MGPVTTVTTAGLSEVDRDALERAMLIAQRDSERAEQLQAKLQQGDDWEDVASLAAFGCQFAALGLRPWQSPPCVADESDPDEPDANAQQLLRKMLAGGVSRYGPDPLRALRKRRRGKA